MQIISSHICPTDFGLIHFQTGMDLAKSKISAMCGNKKKQKSVPHQPGIQGLNATPMVPTDSAP